MPVRYGNLGFSQGPHVEASLEKKKKKAMKKRSDPVGILSPRALTMDNAPQLAESLGWSGSLSQHHPGLLRMFMFYRREN